MRLPLHRDHQRVELAVGELVGVEAEQVTDCGVQAVGELVPHRRTLYRTGARCIARVFEKLRPSSDVAVAVAALVPINRDLRPDPVEPGRRPERFRLTDPTWSSTN